MDGGESRCSCIWGVGPSFARGSFCGKRFGNPSTLYRFTGVSRALRPLAPSCPNPDKVWQRLPEVFSGLLPAFSWADRLPANDYETSLVLSICSCRKTQPIHVFHGPPRTLSGAKHDQTLGLPPPPHGPHPQNLSWYALRKVHCRLVSRGGTRPGNS